jgi:citrate lyase beta subunit
MRAALWCSSLHSAFHPLSQCWQHTLQLLVENCKSYCALRVAGARSCILASKPPHHTRSSQKFLCAPADLDFGSSEAAVRINPVSSGLAADDLAAVLSAKRLPDAVVVPKVESADEVHWVLDRVKTLISSGRQRQLVCDSSRDSSSGPQQQWRRPMAFVPMCESPMSLLNLRWASSVRLVTLVAVVLYMHATSIPTLVERCPGMRTGHFATGCHTLSAQTVAVGLTQSIYITASSHTVADETPHHALASPAMTHSCRHAFEAAKVHPAASMLQLQACILGGDDFAANLGATRTPDNRELDFARGMFLLTCRAMQVQAIDIVKVSNRRTPTHTAAHMQVPTDCSIVLHMSVSGSPCRMQPHWELPNPA